MTSAQLTEALGLLRGIRKQGSLGQVAGGAKGIVHGIWNIADNAAIKASKATAGHPMLSGALRAAPAAGVAAGTLYGGKKVLDSGVAQDLKYRYQMHKMRNQMEQGQ